MNMININEIKAGDSIKLTPNAKAFTFSQGSEYNVLDNAKLGKYIIADDGTTCRIKYINPQDWVKVEHAVDPNFEQPKTINLSLLKEQISIISDKYDEDYHLDLLINFIDGYERGLNAWKRMDILHQIKITARIS